jgi:hypothetical protein
MNGSLTMVRSFEGGCFRDAAPDGAVVHCTDQSRVRLSQTFDVDGASFLQSACKLYLASTTPLCGSD